MHRSIHYRWVAVLLTAMALGLSACSGSGTDFFGIMPSDDFSAVKAKFEAQGYVPEGRDERPYIFTPDDFEGYYTFTNQAPLLAELKSVFKGLQGQFPSYSTQESIFLDSYLLRRGLDDAEAGFTCSAFDGKLLYAYCFIPDIGPVLDHYRRHHDVKGPFLVNEDQGGYSFWYLEDGGEAMIVDTGNDPAADPYGGVVVFYADNVKAFYSQMQAHLRSKKD